MRPPKSFWAALALYCCALGQDSVQQWRSPPDFPYGAVAPVHGRAGQPQFDMLRYPPTRVSHPIRLGGSAPLKYEASLTLEEPLFYTQLELDFPPQKGYEATLRVPLPPGVWVDRVEVDGKRPAVVLADRLPASWHSGRAAANDLLEVPVPVTPGARVSVRVGYLQLLRGDSECRLPLPQLPSSPQVRISGQVATWREQPGTLREVAGEGDIGVYRFNGGGALCGKRWTVVSSVKNAGPGWVVTRTVGGALSWLPRGADKQKQLQIYGEKVVKHTATLLEPDRWEQWLAVPSEVHLGTRRPTPDEGTQIVQGRVLVPYSRLRFDNLGPGGVRPGK